MAVNLSPIWGAGAQLFDNSGNVLSGGKIYTYAAGTTTPATTYTSSSGITANSNPIILNSAGRVPYEIWLSDTVAYKFVLKDSNDTLIATYDNLVGINSNFIAYTAQQEIQTATAGQTVFNLTTMQYQPGTNNLSVFVDGVNQYGPGAQYAYVETDSDTVTFVNGLHVGALVKFTTASPVAGAVMNAENVAYDPPFTGAVGTNVEAKLAQTVSVKDFGAVGDGVTDDTAAIQDALDASQGKVLSLGPQETYLISAITIPAGVTIVANDSVFRKDAASASYAITIDGQFETDSLILSTPGASTDLGVRIKGSFVTIGYIEVTSDAVDSQYGLHIQSTDSSQLEQIKISSVTITNFKAGILHYYVKDSFVNNIRITSYVTGVYLRDTSNCNFRGAYLTGMSPSATGTAGNNGLLVESVLATNSTSNLRFYDWSVVNAAEHSYRFGGNYGIIDVWMTNCRSNLSGYAGAGATGGCGFKVLGGTSTTGERHKNFYFESCQATDVNTSGTGIGNFCGFLIGVADNVHISNCAVTNRNLTNSSWHGMSFESVTGIFLTNNYVKDCKQHGLRFVSATYTAYPGFTGVVATVNISGGFYEVTTGTGSLVMYLDCTGGDAVGTFSNIKTNGIVISKGIGAIRCQGTTTWTNCYADVTYINPGDITGAPPYQGTTDWMLTAKGLYYGTYGSQCLDGSSFQDTAGNFKIKKSGSWVNL